VFQIHANEVALILWHPGLWSFLDFPRLQRLLFGFFERLLLKRFRLLLFEKSIRRFDGGRFYRTVMPDRSKAESVSALAPVEHMSVPVGLAPIDQRLSNSPGSSS
jgi:hypothetical protein